MGESQDGSLTSVELSSNYSEAQLSGDKKELANGTVGYNDCSPHKPKRRSSNRMLLGLLEDANKYDMKSEYELPSGFLRIRRKHKFNEIEIETVVKKKLVKGKTSTKPVKKKNTLEPNVNQRSSLNTEMDKIKRKTKKFVKPINYESFKKGKPRKTALLKSSNSKQSANTIKDSIALTAKNKKTSNWIFVRPNEQLKLSYNFFDTEGLQSSFEGTILNLSDLSKKESKPENTIMLYSVLYPEFFEKFQIDFNDEALYNSILEVAEHVEYAVHIYFPKRYNKQGQKIVEALHLSMQSASNKDFFHAVDKYNNLIQSFSRKEVVEHLKQVKYIPKGFIHYLLQIVYSRCVLPNVHGLKKYRGFSNFVYGELLPSFLSTVYSQCSMKKDHIFVDLGSGVGNCVLQASIEYGCKLSFGCEIMKNASELTAAQLSELRQRCALWGIWQNPIEFCLQQNFIDNDKVNRLLPICDVLLINNFIFDTKLNQMIENLIQGLKPGCKIITLRNLRSSGYTIRFNDVENILNRLKVERFTMPEDSLSWTHTGGTEYFISTVQSDLDESVFYSHAKGRIRGQSRIEYTL